MLQDQVTSVTKQLNKLITEYKAIGNYVSSSASAATSATTGSIIKNSYNVIANSLPGQFVEESLDQVILSLTNGAVSELISTAAVGNLSNNQQYSGQIINKDTTAQLKSIFGAAESWWVAFSTISTLLPESTIVMFSLAKNMAIAYFQQENSKIDSAITSLVALNSATPTNDPNSIRNKLAIIFPQVIADLNNAITFKTKSETFLQTNKDAISAASSLNIASGYLLDAASKAAPLFSKSDPDFSIWGKFYNALTLAQSATSDALSNQLIKVNPVISGLLGWTAIIDKSLYTNTIPGYIIAATITMLNYFDNQLTFLLNSSNGAIAGGPTKQLAYLAGIAPTCAVYGSFFNAISSFLLPTMEQQELSYQEQYIIDALNYVDSLVNPYPSCIDAVTSLYFQATTGFLSADAFSQQINITINLLEQLKKYNSNIQSRMLTIPDYTDTMLEQAINTIAGLTHTSKSNFINNIPGYLNGSAITATVAGDAIACLVKSIPHVVPSEQLVIQQIQSTINTQQEAKSSATQSSQSNSLTDSKAAESIVNGLMEQLSEINDELQFITCVANVPTVVLNQ